MSVVAVVLAVLGLALLMIIHESGHHFIARAFGIRVLRFSIGFGPVLFRHQPRGSTTVYQIALVPFLAYVQVAGMNPFEEVDPDDQGSYANASLTARISTIVAGPLANYFFASVLFLAALLIGGDAVPSSSTVVEVVKGGAADVAHMKTGDKILKIDEAPIATFDEMRKVVLRHPGDTLDVLVQREGKLLSLKVTPAAKAENGGGQILVQAKTERVPVTFASAVKKSLVRPAIVVEQLVVSLARIVTRRERADLAGPVGIVKIAGNAADRGMDEYLEFLGVLSAYLGGFNLLPLPALDGGRLGFLAYEAVTRRRANARVEAGVHFVGLVMLLTLLAVVTVFDFRR
ncbi:MAG TPA: M50 family metallopeptidase [Polyangiaceae bacterium]|nr:M50 family metallopeptidase [Polyangiaceae bacterium]